MLHHQKFRLGLFLVALTVAHPLSQAVAQTSASVTENVRVTDPGSLAPVPENVLRHRVTVAASQVCTEVLGASLWQSTAYADCVRQARRDAEPSVAAILAQRNAGSTAVASASPQR
jgi:UrcA family protein